MVLFPDEKETEFVSENESEGDFDDVDETEGNASLRIKDLKEKLKVAEKERKEYLDGWQRAKADYLNSGKRFIEERADIKARVERELIERLLPLCDSFEAALRSAAGKTELFADGFARIHDQLKGFLSEHSVSAIEEIGVPFDPYQHEALSSEKVSEEAKHDTVVALLQKGYRRGDTLIRPAKVVVGVYEA